ncbi:MAG: glycosyltransferase [Cyanobacteriota bacterium]|nr:glycosyltransferase [Cyanobacteriota bacterium]
MATVAEELGQAIKYHRKNQLALASQIYQKVLQHQPEQPDALYGLGAIAQQLGKPESAQRLLQASLRIQPGSIKAWFSLGNVCQARSQLSEAVICYQRVLDLQPASVCAYNNLGYALQQQGKLSDAIAAYRKALELDPDCREADVNLANTLYAQGKLPAERHGDCAVANAQLGRVCQKAGNVDRAVAYYQQATALDGQLTVAHYLLGNARQSQQRYAEALESYRQVWESPDSQLEETDVCIRLARTRVRALERLLDKPNRPERLKIAFICQPEVMTVFPHPMDSLGILTYEFARLLVCDCDVTVYVPSKTFHKERHEGILFRYIPLEEDRHLVETLATLEIDRDLESPETPSVASSGYFPSYIARVARQLQRDRADIAHVWTFAQFVPILKSIDPNLKMVLHLGDELLLKLDRSLVEKRLSQIDRVLSCSNYVTNKLKRQFPAYSSQFQTLYNGANVDRFLRLSIDAPKPDRSCKQDGKRLLFVGRICPEKGSHILLEAFQKVLERYPNTQLHLVGPTGVMPYEFGIALSDDPIVSALEKFHRDGAWTDYLKAYLSQLTERWGEQIARQLFFPGLLRQSQLVDYYHNCDIFIFPSVWHEPFGMPIVEAMVARMPVISTWGGAFPEIIEDGKTGLLVERGNVGALADAIERTIEDEKLRESIARNAQNRALELFSFETVTANLLHQYQQL